MTNDSNDDEPSVSSNIPDDIHHTHANSADSQRQSPHEIFHRSNAQQQHIHYHVYDDRLEHDNLHPSTSALAHDDDNDMTSSLLPPPPHQQSLHSNDNNMTAARRRITRLRLSTARLRRPGVFDAFLQSDRVRAATQQIRSLGNYLAYMTLCTMLILVPVVIYRALVNRKLDLAAFNSAGIMVAGTVVLSTRLVYLHLTHWYMPEVQKYVVRILWMVPLYATQSYLSLLYRGMRIYLDAIRDFYEAFVIASFVYYLIELLGGQESLVHILQQKRATHPGLGQHKFPLSLILEPWELGVEFMLQCKHGVLQYVVFKTISTCLTYFFEFIGIYGEGKFEWLVAYPYLCFFQNISVMYALYCLVMLFHAVNEELRFPFDWRPLGKFLCVKGVVFFTWWQGVIIFYLKAHGIIDKVGAWSSEDVANGLIDYCVVIEMIGFAIAHSYTFTYKEYLPSNFQHSHQNGNGDNTNDNENSNDTCSDHENGGSGRSSNYRPPATLPQPMKFRDAFWSSAVPRETLQDIQRLRSGVDGAIQEAMRPRAISLQAMNSEEELLQDALEAAESTKSTPV